MRRITFFKMMLIAIALVIGNIGVSAQLLVEDFDYAAGTALTANGWTAHSGGGTNTITLKSPSIFYPGYKSSGVGNEVSLLSSGEDVNKTFTATTSGIIYAAFLVKVTNAGTTADYFFHLGPNTISTTFRGRVWVKKDASNNLAFGVSHTTSTVGSVAFTPFSYSLNSTYLIVLRYTIVSGTANDLSAIYINPVIGDAEPGSGWLSSTDTPSDPTDIGSVALRQGTAGNNVNVTIDGIRIASDWATCVASASGPTPVGTPTFSAIPGNVITSQSLTLSSSTPGATIYYTTDGSDPNNTGSGTLFNVTPITVNSTTTIKAIAYFTGMTTSTVATGVYTFPTEVATLNALRISPVTGFYKLTGEAFITFQSVAGKVKYIQDASAGIVIYDGSGKINTAYSLGDGIKNIYCTLSMYNGMLELIPFADPGVAYSTGKIVTPVVVTLANIANYAGQLVTIKSVAITGAGAFVASTGATTYLVINDGTAGYLRVAYTDLPYIGNAIPSTNQDITGVVNMYSSTEADLIPRTAVDLVATQANGLSSLATFLNVAVSKGNVAFSATAGQTVEVYNSFGQRLVQKSTVEGINTIPVSSKGVVLVKVGDRLTKVIM